MNIKTILASAAMALLCIVDSFATPETDTWAGATATTGTYDFSSSGNWTYSGGGTNVASGDALIFGNVGSTTSLANAYNDESSFSFSALTFNTGLAGPVNISGNAFTLSGTGTATASLTNNNTTSGRNVTISNNITISGSQEWVATGTYGITTLNGNLTDSTTSDIIAINGNGANGTTLPTFQLTGSDSNYDGTINFVSGDGGGVLLGSASAMTGGLIDTTTGSHNTLWLTANTSGSPYTFGIYGTGTGALVKMADGGGDGLFLTANNGGAGGGSIYWDPGAGSNYNWSAGTVANEDTIVVGGSNDANPDTLYLGNSSSQFIISGASKTFKIYSVGNNPGYVTLQSALADGNESTSRTLTTSLNLLTLTQAAVNNSSMHPLNLTVTEVGAYLPGAVSISNVNQLPGGNLNLNGGVLILNGVTWDQFAASRTNATSGNNTYQLSQNTSNSVTTPGGFASTGNITIDGNSTSSSTFSGGFILGSTAVTSTGAEYATGSINLAQNINFSAAENLIFGGNSSVSTAGVYTLGSQTMTLSGNLVGTGSPTLTIAGLNTNGVAGTLVPVVLLSGSNSGLNLSTSNGGGSGFGALVANSDAAFGGGTLMISSATPSGKSTGWLALLSGGYTSSKAISFSSSAAVTAASWGLGSYTGNDVYAGTSTINVSNAASEVIPFNLDAESGSTFALGVTSGTAATFTNNSATGNTIQYRKTGAGTVILQNVTYNGTDTNAVQFNIQNGALQETGSGANNSTVGSALTLSGGVLETNNTNESGGFTRSTSTTTLSGSTINMTGGGGFSAYGGPLTVNLGGATGTVTWNAGGFVNTGNTLVFGSQTANNVVTFQNPINLNGAVCNIEVIGTGSSNEAVLSGALSSPSGGLNLTTASGSSGYLVLTGSNAYTGATTVGSGATLDAAGSGAVTGTANGSLNSTSGVTVNSGGTLLFGTSDQINHSATVALSGGTLAVARTGSSNSLQGNVETMGALTLSARSTIDFGSGTSEDHNELIFSTFSAPGTVLTVNDWLAGSTYSQSSPRDTGSNDELLFSSGTLTTGQLAEIQFNLNGTEYGAIQFADGMYDEVAPGTVVVPEPSTVFAGVCLLGLIGFRSRRRLQELVGRSIVSFQTHGDAVPRSDTRSGDALAEAMQSRGHASAQTESGNEGGRLNRTDVRVPGQSLGTREMGVLHFKRFLEAFSSPAAVPVSCGSADEARRRATFRVLHVKRQLAAPAVRALADAACPGA